MRAYPPETAASAAPEPLLDPFVFPAETRGRFRMLVIAALMLAWTAVSSTFGPPENLRALITVSSPPIIEAPQHTSTSSLATMNRAEIEAARRIVSAEVSRVVRHYAGKSMFVVLSLVLVVAVGVVIYRRHAARYRRRHDTRPLTAEQAPTVVADLRRLARRAGVDSQIRYQVKPGFLGGLAFGLPGRETLVLDGTPGFLERSWGDLYRAVALHELGHIANRDAQYREISKAIWISLCVFGGLALGALVLMPSIVVSSLLGFAIRLTLMLLVVWLIWAGLIRVRELYADWRVAAWGLKTPLRKLLGDTVQRSTAGAEQAAMRSSPETWWRRVGSAVRRLLQHHPSSSQRLGALEDPAALFRLSPELPFLTGLLLGLVWFNTLYLLFDLGIVVLGLFDLAFWQWAGLVEQLELSRVWTLRAAPLIRLVLPVAAFFGFMLAVTHLVTGTVGIQAQRAAVADVATGLSHRWGYLELLAPAGLIALGFEVGLRLSPFAKLSWESRVGWLATSAWVLGFAFLLWLWLVYVRAATRLLLGSHGGSVRPSRSRRFITYSATMLLCVLSLPAVTFRGALVVQQIGPESLGRLVEDPESFVFWMLTTTSFVLALVALGFYVLWTGAIVVSASLRLWSRGVPCACGEVNQRRLVLGRRCEGCRQQLAPWLYAEPLAGEST